MRRFGLIFWVKQGGIVGERESGSASQNRETHNLWGRLDRYALLYPSKY